MLKGLAEALGSGSSTSAVTSLTNFINKRILAFDYLKRSIRGETYFLNICMLGPNDFADSYEASTLSLMSRRFSLLLLSFGRVLSLDNHADVLRACAQLMAEYEHYVGDTIVPDALLSLNFRRGVMEEYYPDSLPAAKGKSTLPISPAGTGLLPGVGEAGSAAHSTSASTAASEKAASAAAVKGANQSEPVKPTLHTAGGAVVYEYMLTSPMPFASLDIIEVYTSFMDTLVQVYARLANVESYAAVPNAMDSFHKFDTRMKHYFTKPTTLQLQQIAAKKVKGAFYSAKARISHVHTEVPSAPALSPDSEAAETKPARPEEDALSQASTQNTAELPPTFTTQQQVVLTGGFVFAAASATAALRASAEAQLNASAQVAGGVGVVLDSNILCGLAHATAETRDLSADVVAGDDLAEGTKSPEADSATASAGSAPVDAAAGTKSTRNLLGGWSGGGKPAASSLLSSKPPTPQETAKQQAAARAQLGAYFGGASGVKAAVKPGKAAPV